MKQTSTADVKKGLQLSVFLRLLKPVFCSMGIEHNLAYEWILKENKARRRLRYGTLAHWIRLLCTGGVQI
jgi:hypothetical protein